MKKVVKIEYPTGSQLLLKIGGIGLMTLGLYLSNVAWKPEYLQILPLVFGLLFLALGLMCFSEGFSTIIIDAEGITQKNLIRKIKIPRNSVKGYAEVTHRTSKQKKNTELIVFDSLGNRKIRCYQGSYGDNYKQLSKEIKLNFRRAGIENVLKIHNQRERLYRNIGKGFGIFIFILGLYQLTFVGIIPQDKLQALTGTLAYQPRIQEKEKRKIESVTYELEEYPGYRFQVVGEYFGLLNPLAKKLDVGAEVKMKILKSDYQEKIEKTTSPDANDKPVNWKVITLHENSRSIDLYEISHRGTVMLSLKSINASRDNPNPKIYMMLIGIGIFLYYKYFSKGYD